MRVIDLSGREHVLQLKGKIVAPDDIRPRSKEHLRAREMLKRLFALYQVYEEVQIPRENLSMDFFIPDKRFVIEVHGKQHYEYVYHFHGDMEGFKASKTRDKRKKEWATLNNFKYVELPYNELEGVWLKKFLTWDE